MHFSWLTVAAILDLCKLRPNEWPIRLCPFLKWFGIKKYISVPNFMILTQSEQYCVLTAPLVCHTFLAATKQLYEWYFPFVRLSVTPFSLCSHHRIIMKFSGVITNDTSDVHAKGQVQRSKVKVTDVKTQLNRFRTVTPVWIHIWWWNGAYSLMVLSRGALLLFKIIRQISRSHGSKNRRIWPRLGISGLQLQFEFTNGYEMMHKAWSSSEEVPYCFCKVIR